MTINARLKVYSDNAMFIRLFKGEKPLLLLSYPEGIWKGTPNELNKIITSTNKKAASLDYHLKRLNLFVGLLSNYIR